MSLKIDEKGNTLILSKEFVTYINEVKNISHKSGFKKQDNMIDLSGQSPGLLYLLGAKSIGTAWNIGGYKGSLDVAKASFNLVDCQEIGSAWILYDSKSPRSISTDLLASLGANFSDQYELVGSWKLKKEIAINHQERTQELYKPINIEQVINSCTISRMKKNN